VCVSSCLTVLHSTVRVVSVPLSSLCCILIRWIYRVSSFKPCQSLLTLFLIRFVFFYILYTSYVHNEHVTDSITEAHSANSCGINTGMIFTWTVYRLCLELFTRFVVLYWTVMQTSLHFYIFDLLVKLVTVFATYPLAVFVLPSAFYLSFYLSRV